MSGNSVRPFSLTAGGLGFIVAIGISLMSASGAQAATTINGPIDLGGATTFGALGATALTNTGPSVLNGDIGVSPGTSITGFTGPPTNGSYTGAEHKTDAFASDGQTDLVTAFNTAAGLTPTTSGLGDLSGLSLSPGVYSGGALSLSGTLTLAGGPTSVWVFQAASTLITASASVVTVTGGASDCNVFWEVGSSATLGSSSQFVGTIMAKQAITATTGATVRGRLLASNAAVTLDHNVITVPSGCAPPATPTVTGGPAITSGTPTGATTGTPYSFTVVATGTPTPTYAVGSGSLPAGLVLNSSTGAITGTPTTPGESTFTITAANSVGPDVSAVYTITTAAAASPATAVSPASGSGSLADTGSNIGPSSAVIGTTGASLLAVGLFFVFLQRSRGLDRALSRRPLARHRS